MGRPWFGPAPFSCYRGRTNSFPLRIRCFPGFLWRAAETQIETFGTAIVCFCYFRTLITPQGGISLTAQTDIFLSGATFLLGPVLFSCGKFLTETLYTVIFKLNYTVSTQTES